MNNKTISDLKTWQQIKQRLLSYGSGWVFRGHSDASWRLSSTLERYCKPFTPSVGEELLSRRFKRNAYSYLRAAEIPVDDVEWLALMQHHGAPTRLLDWTTSPFVAALFALEEATNEKGTSAVWAVDAAWCRDQGSRIISDSIGKPVPEDITWPREFHALVIEQKLRFVMPVEPFRRNARLTIQNGTFLFPGDINAGFEANFSSYDQSVIKQHILKIEVPSSLRQEVLQDLNLMNINRATLFPGIDGFAQSLKSTTMLLERPEQLAQKLKIQSDLA